MLLRSRGGYSLAMWAITFGVLIAVLFMMRPIIEKALRTKVYATTDHFLWGSWDQEYKYKGEKTTKSKTKTHTQQTMESAEADGGKSILYVGPKNKNKPATETDSAYMSVEEGSEALLNETVVDINDLNPH